MSNEDDAKKTRAMIDAFFNKELLSEGKKAMAAVMSSYIRDKINVAARLRFGTPVPQIDLLEERTKEEWELHSLKEEVQEVMAEDKKEQPIEISVENGRTIGKILASGLKFALSRPSNIHQIFPITPVPEEELAMRALKDEMNSLDSGITPMLNPCRKVRPGVWYMAGPTEGPGYFDEDGSFKLWDSPEGKLRALKKDVEHALAEEPTNDAKK